MVLFDLTMYMAVKWTKVKHRGGSDHVWKVTVPGKTIHGQPHVAAEKAKEANQEAQETASLRLKRGNVEVKLHC